MQTEVLVIGSLNMDLLIKQNRLPSLGETFSANSFIQMPGGKGANQAVQCAKLGLNVAMVGCVGEDTFGDELISSLQTYGVQKLYIKRSGTSGLGIVQILPNGDYYSTVIKGANYAIQSNDIHDCYFQDKPLIILQSEIPYETVEYAIKKAVHYECKVLLNNAPAREIGSQVLSMVNYLVVNETETNLMTGIEIKTIDDAIIAGQKLLPRIKEFVVITLGEKGSVLVSHQIQKHFSAVFCDNVVDATGAGDSYIGAFSYGLIKKMELSDIIKFASMVSSLSLKHIGGQASFPCIKDISL